LDWGDNQLLCVRSFLTARQENAIVAALKFELKSATANPTGEAILRAYSKG
jgi:hypothetical protein